MGFEPTGWMIQHTLKRQHPHSAWRIGYVLQRYQIDPKKREPKASAQQIVVKNLDELNPWLHSNLPASGSGVSECRFNVSIEHGRIVFGSPANAAADTANRDIKCIGY